MWGRRRTGWTAAGGEADVVVPLRVRRRHLHLCHPSPPSSKGAYAMRLLIYEIVSPIVDLPLLRATHVEFRRAQRRRKWHPDRRLCLLGASSTPQAGAVDQRSKSKLFHQLSRETKQDPQLSQQTWTNLARRRRHKIASRGHRHPLLFTQQERRGQIPRGNHVGGAVDPRR